MQSRNRYVDLLRALAIARVVVYHTTGWAALTIVFPAMGMMFALAGSLMAASLDRHGVRAVGRRLRRLLPPLWIMAAIFVPAMVWWGMKTDWRLVLWGLPVLDPPANGWGSMALSVIWYLRDYLWFVLLSPLALPLFRRFPIPMIALPLGLLVAIQFGMPAINLLRDFALYFAFWLVGFAHHDGMLKRLSRRALFATAGALAAAGAAWFLTHPGPRGYDLNDIRLGDGLWSMGFVILILGLAPATMSWLERVPVLSRSVSVLNGRAVTIYLWHMPVVVGLAAVLGPVGLWEFHRIVGRLLLVVAGLAVAVALFGWVEDVAARRRPVLLPGGRRRTTVPVPVPEPAAAT